MWMYLESFRKQLKSVENPIVWCYQSGVDDLFFKANKEFAKVKIQRCNSPSLSPILVFQFFSPQFFQEYFQVLNSKDIDFE